MPLTIDTNLFAVSLFAKEAFNRKGQKGFCVVFDVLIRVNDSHNCNDFSLTPVVTLCIFVLCSDWLIMSGKV